MRFPYRGLALIMIILLTGLAGCASRQAPMPGDDKAAKALFEEKCSFCHGLNVALEESHTLAGWQDLVEKEAARKVWFISSAQQEAIAAYLFKILPADQEKPPGPKEPSEDIHDNPERIRTGLGDR